MSDSSSLIISKIIGNSDEINSIQKEIEVYTKNIEHEKINLRLAKERYQKQYEDLIKLQNLGKLGTKDKGAEKTKHNRRGSMENLHKESTKFETNLENINDEINNLALENKELRRNIEELRKDKLTVLNLLENLKITNENTKNKFEELHRQNRHNKEDIDGVIRT